MRVDLDKWGRIGVQMLKDATPVETGKTQASWEYRIEHGRLQFVNTNGKRILYLTDGYTNQYGQWVQGNDFVSPIIKYIQNAIEREVNPNERGKLRRKRIRRQTRR